MLSLIGNFLTIKGPSLLHKHCEGYGAVELSSDQNLRVAFSVSLLKDRGKKSNNFSCQKKVAVALH